MPEEERKYDILQYLTVKSVKPLKSWDYAPTFLLREKSHPLTRSKLIIFLKLSSIYYQVLFSLAGTHISFVRVVAFLFAPWINL